MFIWVFKKSLTLGKKEQNAGMGDEYSHYFTINVLPDFSWLICPSWMALKINQYG